MSRNIRYLVSQMIKSSYVPWSQKIITQKPAVNSARSYSRWTHRKPGKVILPFEPTGKVNLKKEKVIDLDPSIINKTQGAVSKTMKVINADSRDEIVDDRPVSTFDHKKSKKIITEREEKIKKRKFYLSQKKKERLRSGQMLVEGWRLIVDGLEAKCKLKYVIFSRTDELDKIRPFLPKTGVVFYKVPYKEIELFSDVETAPGIFGIFETPTVENVKRLSNPLPLHFLCDNIRMSGNLGAILRAAVGVGLLPYYGVEFTSMKHITLVIGGETEGISQESYALATQKNGLRLNIPLQRGVDSLNTGMATGVIAFEIRKQLIQAWTKIKKDRLLGVAT
ncbi:putative RNA methyltransferase like 1 [Operophtera brumata]|uniref:Putative RNA methyltransferase like 1 n=1 Tax=Operophtera brumata TaxID=104452 RepID=A0A0L7LKB0_OPEBR|nr:putative RNA methyltransferase like 1 [Operophtera brumata]